MQGTARGRTEGGYVLLVFALLLFPLLVVAALAIDYGAWVLQANRQQSAADAAALAGAPVLPDTDRATALALEVAGLNGYDPADPDVTVEVTFPDTKTIRVTISDRATLHFAGAVLEDDRTISRFADASAIAPLTMGSPSNVLGFGPYSLHGSDVANYWILENNDCQVGHYGDVRAAQYLASPWCDTIATRNPTWKRANEDRFSGYTFIVTIPPGLATSSTLMIFDPGKCRGYGSKPADGSWNRDGRGTELQWRIWDTNDTPLIPGDDTPATTWWGSDACAADLPYGPGAWVDTSAGWTATPFEFPANTSAEERTYVVQTRVLDSTRQGWNHYAYWVRPNNGTTSCSTLTDPTCPTIGAETWIATQARGASVGAPMDLYLAEIGREHDGRTLKVSLWDPGEGMDNIQIVDPLGNSLDFTWESDDPAHPAENPADLCGGDPCLYLDPANRRYPPKLTFPGWGNHYRFNGRNVTLSVTLDSQVDFDAYASAPLGSWFRLRFYPEPHKRASEWASFSVAMSGDPIRLTD